MTMKCQLIIDPKREEEVLIYVKKDCPRAREIERFVEGEESLYGYAGNEIVPLCPDEIVCFMIREGKVFALTEEGEFSLRERLYQIEEKIPDVFLKINQSCIANMKKIRKFEVSFGGALLVIFQNGHRDYVSRRRLSAVKERLGLK